MTRKQRKAYKAYQQMLIEVENFKQEFNMLKGKRKIKKRVYHKDYTKQVDWYTKSLIWWEENPINYYRGGK